MYYRCNTERLEFKGGSNISCTPVSGDDLGRLGIRHPRNHRRDPKFPLDFLYQFVEMVNKVRSALRIGLINVGDATTNSPQIGLG